MNRSTSLATMKLFITLAFLITSSAVGQAPSTASASCTAATGGTRCDVKGCPNGNAGTYTCTSKNPALCPGAAFKSVCEKPATSMADPTAGRASIGGRRAQIEAVSPKQDFTAVASFEIPAPTEGPANLSVHVMTQCHNGKLYVTTTTIDDKGNMTSTMTSGVACEGNWVRHNQIY